MYNPITAIIAKPKISLESILPEPKEKIVNPITN